VGISPN